MNNWRASETLSGVANGNRRYICRYVCYVVCTTSL